MSRTLYNIPHVDGGLFDTPVMRNTRYEEDLKDAIRTNWDEANLVGSVDVSDRSTHWPMFDVDDPYNLTPLLDYLCYKVRYPLRTLMVVPSRTFGHFHIYVQIPRTWDEYSNLLYFNPFICRAWAEACRRQGQGFLRRPPQEVWFQV